MQGNENSIFWKEDAKTAFLSLRTVHSAEGNVHRLLLSVNSIMHSKFFLR